MAQAHQIPQWNPAGKRMTFGEAGSAIAFAALALVSIIVAAKAHTPEYAFHAYLFAAASAAATFAIIDRFYSRPAELPAREIDGNLASSPATSSAEGGASGTRFAATRHKRNAPSRSEEKTSSPSAVHANPKMEALSAVT